MTAALVIEPTPAPAPAWVPLRDAPSRVAWRTSAFAESSGETSPKRLRRGGGRCARALPHGSSHHLDGPQLAFDHHDEQANERRQRQQGGQGPRALGRIYAQQRAPYPVDRPGRIQDV